MMNKLIEKLKEQAEIKFEAHPQHMGIDTAVITPADLEKFAELIVRDCMDVVDGYTKGRTFDTHYDAVEQIEALFGIKHNGVEE
jgi:hypothetical protein